MGSGGEGGKGRGEEKGTGSVSGRSKRGGRNGDWGGSGEYRMSKGESGHICRLNAEKCIKRFAAQFVLSVKSPNQQFH